MKPSEISITVKYFDLSNSSDFANKELLKQIESFHGHLCPGLTMETRIRKFGGRDLCIPCFEKIEAR